MELKEIGYKLWYIITQNIWIILNGIESLPESSVPKISIATPIILNGIERLETAIDVCLTAKF